MRTPSALLLSILLSAGLFTVVFYKQFIGLNLLLFEGAIILVLYAQRRITLDVEVLMTTFGTLLTALMVVVHNSALAITVNFFSLFLMIGTLLYPKARALSYSFAFSLCHVPYAQFEFFKQVAQLGNGRPAMGRAIRWMRIVVIPLVILVVFISIYQAANPMFAQLVTKFTDRLAWLVKTLTAHLDAWAVLTFILGVLICDFLLLHTTEKSLVENVVKVSDHLRRTKEPSRKIKMHLGLRREWRSALFLLVILNVLLFVVNCIDIYWVWFNFEWSGDYLKQFVHEGTNLLIFSIIISVLVILYIFKNNLNFLSTNGLLKKLAYVWLAQNVILALSVGVRNYHYIQHYALAHKRIGVMFFLLATIVGLITVMVKVQKKRSAHYLFRTNFMACYCILVLMTVVNWDVLIAKFNFAHADRSFVHLDYLVTLCNGALPHLSHNPEELKRIETGNKRFPSDVNYMTSQRYLELLERRELAFAEKMQTKHWLSWNWTEHSAYQRLKAK